MALSIYPLDLGDLELDTSFVNWQTDCGKKGWFPTTAWLILGAEKPVMIDSSFRSVADAKENQGLVARRANHQTLEAQLGKHGLKPADIGYLIHTHVHMDHAGQDRLLSNAKIFVQRKELQNAAAPNMYPVPFYDRLNVARLVDELWGRVEVFDGPDEPIPGIRLEPFPGHTPGHQIVHVRTGSGEVIVCGDAAMNVSTNVELGVIPGFVDNVPDVINGLKKLKRSTRVILPTHDPEVLLKYAAGIA